ncbi:hypothetical protein [uncultured Maricaulis sp.]|uniref:hypothetical protein n=1 Tax=uncultured Maricaulis sp. TaxID=174710 RepID=UPI00262D2A86|nr:hypothetical protein [uncultured Maricaulis sp.]
MQGLFGVETANFGLVVHIGCGDDAGRFWQGRVDDLVLVEPDPERANAVRKWLDGGGSGKLVEAAVAERNGDGSFRRTSFGDLNSLRVPTGAMTLFPGLRSLESVPVKLIQPRNLLAARGAGVSSGRSALVVDAPSEVLLVLSDLDEAGLLDDFDAVVIRVAEVQLHEGGADLEQVEAWLTGSQRRIVWESDPADPDVRFALVEKDWKACNLRNEKRALELETIVSELRHSYSRMSEENRASLDQLNEEAGALTAARDQARAEAQAAQSSLDSMTHERDALNEELDRLRTEHDEATQAAQSSLESMTHERDALKEEMVAQQEANSKAAESAKNDLETLKQQVNELKAARDQTAKDAQANLAAFETMRSERDRLKAELEAARHRYDDQDQATKRLSAEIDALRDDNRLSLRIQRIAQADLADLQDRYAMLADEKRQLEQFLDGLAQKVIESEEKESLPAPKRTAGRTRAASKSTTKRAGTKNRAKPS